MGQFEDMDTFVRIVEAGSISEAAHQIGIVKSAVSRRLVDLERRLGVQLLHRTTRHSHLTEAGKSYYEKSLEILNEVTELNALTSNSLAALKGTLKISAGLSFGLQHLTSAINEFADLHPDLNIHMDFNDRHIDLVEEGYDLTIRITNLKDSSLIARKLAPIKRVACASPDYLTRNGFPKTPEDLKEHDILHYTNSGSKIWHFITPEGKEKSINLPTKMASNNGDFLKDAAKAGRGITLSPTFICWQELRKKELIPLFPTYHFSDLNAYAVYPPTRHLTHRVRVFIDFLKEKFGDTPYWDMIV